MVESNLNLLSTDIIGNITKRLLVCNGKFMLLEAILDIFGSHVENSEKL